MGTTGAQDIADALRKNLVHLLLRGSLPYSISLLDVDAHRIESECKSNRQ